jgi:transposase
LKTPAVPCSFGIAKLKAKEVTTGVPTGRDITVALGLPEVRVIREEETEQEIRVSSQRVEVVVMDMHKPFRQAVELCLPRAKVVADKFHVPMHIHRALDQVRTSLQPQKGKKGELFRARYLLLTAVERLSAERRVQLIELLERYPILRSARSLKEAFRDWYHSPSRTEAEVRLNLWENSVNAMGIGPFRALFPMLRIWRKEILNYFDHPYTNGFLEGKNNRIKVIKRIAYGYRNQTNFRQRILLTNRRKAHLKAIRGASHLLT